MDCLNKKRLDQAYCLWIFTVYEHDRPGLENGKPSYLSLGELDKGLLEPLFKPSFPPLS